MVLRETQETTEMGCPPTNTEPPITSYVLYLSGKISHLTHGLGTFPEGTGSLRTSSPERGNL